MCLKPGTRVEVLNDTWAARAGSKAIVTEKALDHKEGFIPVRYLIDDESWTGGPTFLFRPEHLRVIDWRQPSQFLIEGVDRMGKSSLIQLLQETLGYHLVVHYEKPKKLMAYCEENNSLKSYQMDLYKEMFRMISAKTRVIFDRAHLGELVYAPMYRKYDTSYIHNQEEAADTSSARLVLLTTSDFSFIQDDGLSIDFSKKEEEQAKFIEAFHASKIKDKVLVDVSSGFGGYKTYEEILKEVLKK